jgi:hypothetical protein
MENNTHEKALAIIEDDDTGLRGDLVSRTTSFCSLTPVTMAEKARLYNLMNAPEFTVKKFINKIILMQNLFMEKVLMTNEETGEVTEGNRIVIIDKDFHGYSCVATGVFSSLKKIVQSFGEPPWAEPIPIEPFEISKAANKNILTLRIVVDTPKGK